MKNPIFSNHNLKNVLFKASIVFTETNLLTYTETMQFIDRK